MDRQRSIAVLAVAVAAACNDDSGRDPSAAGFGVFNPSPTGLETTTGDPPGPPDGPDDTTSEPGTTSTGAPGPICGDGHLDLGEQCDFGDDNGPDSNCHADCTLDVCGDGVIGVGEQCDLGDDNGPDAGCSPDCTLLPSACGDQLYLAELVPRPVDVIFVIDNSGSMSDEIEGVEANINAEFAGILDQSGLDYRVVMLSLYGHHDSNEICIEAPLAGIPPGGCADPPPKPVAGARFFHYSAVVDSTNGWCRILETLDGELPDTFKFAPTGWQEWLREGSFKIFVTVTDDRVSCFHGAEFFDDFNNVNSAHATALAFDAALREAAPQHFGPLNGDRNYRFYSVAGVAPKDPQNTPYSADDPLVLDHCPTAVNAGLGHQGLSVLTGGLRFPACEPKKLGNIFSALAAGVIADVDLACELELPSMPLGKQLDPASIEVRYTPPKQQDPVVFAHVPDLASCIANAWYLDDDTVVLCPGTCAAVQQEGATLELAYSCFPLPPG